MTSADNDVSAIAQVRERMQSGENAGDADAIAAVLADDVVLIVPDFPVQEGRAACVAFLRELLDELFARFNREIIYASDDVTILGELAYDRGTFSFTVVDKNGGPTAIVNGKYFWLLRRIGVEWRVWRAIVTRDEENSGEC